MDQPIRAGGGQRVFGRSLPGLRPSTFSTDNVATSSSPRDARASAAEPSRRRAWSSITSVA